MFFLLLSVVASEATKTNAASSEGGGGGVARAPAIFPSKMLARLRALDQTKQLKHASRNSHEIVAAWTNGSTSHRHHLAPLVTPGLTSEVRKRGHWPCHTTKLPPACHAAPLSASSINQTASAPNSFNKTRSSSHSSVTLAKDQARKSLSKP